LSEGSGNPIWRKSCLGRSFSHIYPLVNVYITMERSTHFWWVNQLFLCPFSIAFCMFTRGYSIQAGHFMGIPVVSAASNEGSQGSAALASQRHLRWCFLLLCGWNDAWLDIWDIWVPLYLRNAVSSWVSWVAALEVQERQHHRGEIWRRNQRCRRFFSASNFGWELRETPALSVFLVIFLYVSGMKSSRNLLSNHTMLSKTLVRCSQFHQNGEHPTWGTVGIRSVHIQLFRPLWLSVAKAIAIQQGF
jgi:hypothetical protein